MVVILNAWYYVCGMIALVTSVILYMHDLLICSLVMKYPFNDEFGFIFLLCRN